MSSVPGCVFAGACADAPEPPAASTTPATTPPPTSATPRAPIRTSRRVTSDHGTHRYRRRMPIEPPSPLLSDGEIALRPWRERDVLAIVAACRDEDIAWWLDQVPQPYDEADARTYVAMTRRGWKDGTHAAFAVTDAATGEVVGSVGLHWLDTEQGVAEVGYWVRRELRGRGVATRATRLAARWALTGCGMARLQL